MLVYPKTILQNDLPHRVVSNYAALRVAAGGTLSNTAFQAFYRFVDYLHSRAVWSDIKEFWYGSGSTLAQGLIKLTHPVGIQSSLTAVGFTSTNYTEAGGFLGKAGAYLRTGFVPSVQLASYRSCSIGTYIKSFARTGTATNISYMGAQDTGFRLSTTVSTNSFSGDLLNTYSKPSAATANSFLCASNVSATEGFLALNGSSIVSSASVGASALPATEVTVYTAGASTLLTNIGRQYCYFIGSGLTLPKVATIQQAIVQLNLDMGR